MSVAQSLMRYELMTVRPPVPALIWDKLRPKFERALEQGGPLTVAGMLADVNEGRAGMLVVCDSANGSEIVAGIIAEVEEWPGRAVLTVVAAAGQDFDGWIDVVQGELERVAERMGCDAIRAVCRPGMGKWLKEIGYKPVLETLEYRHGR